VSSRARDAKPFYLRKRKGGLEKGKKRKGTKLIPTVLNSPWITRSSSGFVDQTADEEPRRNTHEQSDGAPHREEKVGGEKERRETSVRFSLPAK